MRLLPSCGRQLALIGKGAGMATLWIEQEVEWLAVTLTERTYVFGAGRLEPAADGRDDVTRLVRRDGIENQWLALTGAGARVLVNGRQLLLGIRLLRDRDEMLDADETGRGRRCYFCSQEPPRVEPLPAEYSPTRCPRCKQAVVAGTPAVRCPNCGLWHHQTDQLPCWDYAATCTCCPQTTDLNAGYPWTPEAL